MILIADATWFLFLLFENGLSKPSLPELCRFAFFAQRGHAPKSGNSVP
jgi:hypothetical protein